MGAPTTRPAAAGPSAQASTCRPRADPASPAAVAAAAALVALLAVGAGVLVDLATPAPRPADAPADEFSAGRAYEDVQVIAARPHVAGSPANDQVRAHLSARCAGWAWRPRCRTRWPRRPASSAARPAGRPWPGSATWWPGCPAPTRPGRVFLVAHYDSVQTGPGGNDDAAGTSTILEVARALTHRPPPRNDIVFVLTDAEEACLCGASGVRRRPSRWPPTAGWCSTWRRAAPPAR